MSEIKISVIIPVYNVEKYLKRCLDSVLQYKENDIEFILVNDGSTDSSPVIIDDYAKKDSRLKVYSKDNEGLYKTWKYGLRMSLGEYIMFVDSDDYINSDVFIRIKELVSQYPYDMISFNYFYSRPNGKELYISSIDTGAYIGADLEKIRNKFVPGFDKGGFSPARWNKAIKKSLLIEFIPYSISEINGFEDSSVTYPLCTLINSLYVINEGYYYYCINASSITQNPKNLRKNYDDCIKLNKYLSQNIGFNISEANLASIYFGTFITSLLNAIYAKDYSLANEICSDAKFYKLLSNYDFKKKIVGYLLVKKHFRLYNVLRKLKSIFKR